MDPTFLLPIAEVTDEGVTDAGKAIALGTWRHPLGRDFVALHGRGQAVVVELAGMRWLRLVITSPDAEGDADDIREAAAETQRWAGGGNP